MVEDLFMIDDGISFAYSPENLDGTKGGGSHGKECSKLHPTVNYPPLNASH
jgi:hypothetical protein